MKWPLSIAFLLFTGSITANDIDFNRDIRPILSNHCFACHGPDSHDRKGGNKEQGGLRLDQREGALADLGGHAAIVSGNPEESEFVARIRSTDPGDIMPPPDYHKPLKSGQIRLLEKWIETGAEYARHWSFSPVVKPEVPETSSANAIDHFILGRLARHRLTLSAPADPRTLIRRLSFDITGLPPAPEEVEAFISDQSENAYEKAVDRLLASPHFGERLAAYWLDLVRYADSNGYHADLEWSVWPYRDYVIEAFNDNMPFDHFTREQLAGDLLPGATLKQRIAAGYNRLNMKSTEFGIQDKEYLAKYASDRVRTTSGVWMGLTLGCAECHDHKFDPLTIKDFYQFAAFFSDIKQLGFYPNAQKKGWGESFPVPDQEITRQIDTLRTEREQRRLELERNQPEWSPMHVVSLKSDSGILHAADDHSILASGPMNNKGSYAVTAKSILESITAFRLEALPHKGLPKGGPGRAGNGNFVVTEFRVMKGKTGIKLQNPRASFEQSQFANKNPYKLWSAASAIDGDVKGDSFGWAILPKVNEVNSAVFDVAPGTSLPPENTYTFIIEQNHSNHRLGHFRLLATNHPNPVEPAQDKRILEIDRQITRLEKSHPSMLATVSTTPMTTRVLPRGNWMDDSGEIVPPAVPAFFQYQFAPQKRASRLDLARWLVEPENPLTSRVFVNRLWKLYFGTGLSRYLDDVGAQGEAPSHPALLDWLAHEFIASGWDIKYMIKLLVMSDTYRQSSLPVAELEEHDPYNRLLARQSRFRLDAEMIRDNALAASGLLVRETGGPSIKPYQPEGYWAHLFFPRRTYQHDTGNNQYRRAVYTHWQRQFLHPAMKLFDAPSREECTAERPRSNTPLGALALLNDPTHVEAARVLAQGAMQAETQTNERIQWMARRVLARELSTAEIAVLEKLLSQQISHYSHHPGEAKQLLSTGMATREESLHAYEHAAWTFVARALLNMHETVTRN